MRIALPLSFAAFLFAASVPAIAAPGTAQSQETARQRQAHLSHPRTTPAAKPAGAAQGRAESTRPAVGHPTTTRQGSQHLARASHGARSYNYARGVEASHPGLGEPAAEAGNDGAPQMVRFPGAVPGGLPLVLDGGPSVGSPGGYCGQMLMPAVALREVSRGFSRGHSGIDLMAAHGTPIRAAAAGTVIYAGWYFAYGNIVDIRHADGVVTRYAHMSAFAPNIGPGTPVGAGEEIGKVGATGHATGPHVHFEVRLGGRAVDPRPYLALAGCDGTTPRDELLEAYADERPTTGGRRTAARARVASRQHALPVRH